MKENNKLVQPGALSASERSQKLASALSSYARMLTFENRSRRNLYRLAGLAPRTRDKIFSILIAVCFALTFVIPLLMSVIYYTMVASPGYVSEVRFVLRSSAPMLSRDRYASSTVEPKAKIVQDTAVLLNYLDSPALIEDVSKNISLQKYFGRDQIDYFSRLKPEANQDKTLKYWRKHYSASVNPKSGIVELQVTAYSPQEAKDLLQLILKLSEAQVNKLSAGMWNDLLITTQHDVENATKDVSNLRASLRDIQNTTGVFDIDMSAERFSSVLTGVEASIADLKSRKAALAETVGSNAPQVAEIDRRLQGLESQSKELQNKTAGVGKNSLAAYSTSFDTVKLDLRLGEDRLQSAITDLEKVKLVSSLQLVYVDNFTQPTLPDDATYPKPLLELFLRFLVFSSVTIVVCGLISIVRKKLD
ncbi:hypothetical protein G6L37_34290 [Agrobacterium rubi]|uniref:hypothetical protein n=1 Tax=Agrobacterium rubi TaxID=28099 RepID=UPI001574234F|nr:hypothetical protein [Agrobacterium rubi]NTF11077.1 hypothetical protein [Agrobacterium rubi]NTF23450.1 hypothetical protein [Agrobacterium rubi]NTF30403.1 hypothetical protein [Agrobacterium rubi]